MNITNSLISERTQEHLAITHESYNSDFILPDYCKDISKILNCTVVPFVEAITHSDDKISVAGELSVNLIYVNSDNEINTYENIIKYNKIIRCDKQNDLMNLFAQQEVIVSNIRALGPKRFNVNGTVEIKISALIRNNNEFISLVEEKDIQKKIDKRDLFQISYFGCKRVSINSVLTENTENPACGILRKACNCFINEVKTIKDKIYINGEYKIMIVYYDDKCKINTFTAELPLSEVIEAAGVSENDICYISNLTDNINVILKNDTKGYVQFDVRLTSSFILTCGQYKKPEMLTDVFSTKNKLSEEYISIDTISEMSKSNKIFTVETEIECNEERINIPDAFLNNIKISFEIKENSATVIADGSCCVLIEGENENIQFYEDKITKEFHIPKKENTTAYEVCSVSMTSCSALQVQGNKIRFTCDLSVDYMEISECKVKTLSKLAVAETESEDNNCGIILYYAQEREALWDIAKKNAVPVDKIASVNDISDDLMPCERMLILPKF